MPVIVPIMESEEGDPVLPIPDYIMDKMNWNQSTDLCIDIVNGVVTLKEWTDPVED